LGRRIEGKTERGKELEKIRRIEGERG